MLPSLFKKHTELEQEPNTLTNDAIVADLLVNEDDPLYSDNVKCILSSKDAHSDKSETLNSKSFRTIEKILQLKEDLLSEQRHLEEKLNDLSSLRNALDSYDIEEIQNSSCDSDSQVLEKGLLNKK